MARGGTSPQSRGGFFSHLPLPQQSSHYLPLPQRSSHYLPLPQRSTTVQSLPARSGNYYGAGCQLGRPGGYPSYYPTLGADSLARQLPTEGQWPDSPSALSPCVAWQQPQGLLPAAASEGQCG